MKKSSKLIITKEQYVRLLAKGMINESEEPVQEKVSTDELKRETFELLAYLYRRSNNLSPFWKEHGISYDEIIDALLTNKLIIKKDGVFELSKAMGDVKTVTQAVENELGSMLNVGNVDESYLTGPGYDSNDGQKDKKLELVYKNNNIALFKFANGTLYVFHYGNIDGNELSNYAVQMDNAIENYVNDNLRRFKIGIGVKAFENPNYDLVKVDKELGDMLRNDGFITEDANYEDDGLFSSENQNKGIIKRESEDISLNDSGQKRLKLLYANDEVALFNSSNNLMYVFWVENIPHEVLYDYQLDYDEDDYDIMDSIVETYVNRNINKLRIGVGLKAYESGYYDLVRIDGQLGADLCDVYSMDKEFVKTIDDGFDKIDNLDEETSCGSVGGSYEAPMGGIIKRELQEVTTTAGGESVGEYDANAFPGITGDGKFVPIKKPMAFKKTQLTGGSFVHIDDCTKLNNNKEAQNGRCNAGAVDKVVTSKKSKGNVSAPSLGENKIKQIKMSYKEIISNILNEVETPGISVTNTVKKQSGTANKAGIKAIEKDTKNYGNPTKASTKDVPVNKFNYKDDKEKEYHDQMEIMNGQEMIEYDREPNDDFKKRAKEAIEGSSRMGNGKTDNAEPTDKVNKGIVKNAKASSKKRLDAEKGIMSFGDDVEILPKGSKPMNRHSAYNEDINNNKTQVKETMKRLKFKKEFGGVGNALRLIPENYKMDDKIFEMTDGNELYRIRWEGTITEGMPIVLRASNKKMVAEDIDKMKRLMGYKPEIAQSNFKSTINENQMFKQILNKSRLVAEGEDEEELEEGYGDDNVGKNLTPEEREEKLKDQPKYSENVEKKIDSKSQTSNSSVIEEEKAKSKKVISIKQLINLAHKAHNFGIDVSDSLIDLGIEYEEKVPLYRVIEILEHYDIKLEDVVKEVPSTNFNSYLTYDDFM